MFIWDCKFTIIFSLSERKQNAEPVDIKIQSADGKIHLISRYPSGLIKINTSHLPAGSYFLHLTNRLENRICKIVKVL